MPSRYHYSNESIMPSLKYRRKTVKTQQYPSNNIPKFMIRWSEEAKEQVKIAAAKNRRSMNAEVLTLIEEGFTYRAEQTKKEEQAA